MTVQYYNAKETDTYKLALVRGKWMQADLLLKCHVFDDLISRFMVLTCARSLDISEVPLRPGLLPDILTFDPSSRVSDLHGLHAFLP